MLILLYSVFYWAFFFLVGIMRLNLLLLFGLVLLSACGNSRNELLTIAGRIDLEESPRHSLVEVRFYTFDENLADSTVIAYAHCDHEGRYQVKIPRDNQYYKLHISSPGYYAIIQDFVLCDDSHTLTMNAFLKKIRVGADCEDVSVIGDFNNWSHDAAYATKRIDDELYEVWVEYEDTEMEYQIVFGDFEQTFTIYEFGKEYCYDHGGDYRIIAKSDNDDYSVRVRTTGLCDDDDPSISSILSFESNHVYKQIQSLENEFGAGNTEKMILDYIFFVEKDDPDLLKKIPRRKRKDLETKAKNELSSGMILLDSLISNPENQIIKDIALSKRIVLMSNLWGDSLSSEIWSNFMQMRKIPANETALFESILSIDKIQNEPYKYLGIIVDKINCEKSTEMKSRLLVDYYDFVDEYLNDEGKFTEMLLRGLVPMRNNSGLTYSLRSEIEELYDILKLKEKSLKPEVRFVLADTTNKDNIIS
jgi:hypothetical protein